MAKESHSSGPGKGELGALQLQGLELRTRDSQSPQKRFGTGPSLKAHGRSQRQLVEDSDQVSEALTRAQLKGAPKHSGIETNVLM